MSDLTNRAIVVQNALTHCYNDRGCVSCPMYSECEGDVSTMISQASEIMADLIHQSKCEKADKNAAGNVIRCPDCAYYGKSPFGHPTLGWCRIDGKHRGRNFFCGNADGKGEANK